MNGGDIKPERHCSVPDCDASASNNVFHKVPTNEEAKRQWIEACNITNTAETEAETIYICSSHFDAEDYTIGPYAQTLKKCAIPSKNVAHEELNFEEFIPDSNSQLKLDEADITSHSLAESFEELIPAMQEEKITISSNPTENGSDFELQRLVEVEIESQNSPDHIEEVVSTVYEQKPEIESDSVRNGISKRWCCIPGCQSKPQDKRSFHHFPKHKKIKQEWITACNLGKVVKPYMSVCSAHFEKDDYLTSPESKRQVLKSVAVPSLNLPVRKQIKVVFTDAETSSPDANLCSTNTKNDEDKKKVTTIIYVPKSCSKIVAKNPSNIQMYNVNTQESTHDLQQNDARVLQNQNPVKVIIQKNNTIGQKQSNINIRNQRGIADHEKISTNIQNQIDKNVCKQQSTSVQKQDSVNTPGISNKIIVKREENVKISIERRGNKNIVLRKQNDIHTKTKLDDNNFRKKSVSAITLCAGCGQYCKIDDEDLLDIKKNTETLAAEALLELQEVNPSNEDERTLLTRKGIEICDKVIQKHSINLIALLTNNNELMAFTGVNLELLDKLTKLVTLSEGRNANKYTNSVRERVVICLCKLRTNLPFRCLAVLFGITQKMCASYFFSMVRTLSLVLDKTIYWSKTEELLKNLPKCFQSFKQTRVILNCSESQVEKQRCLKCQLELISNNKQYESVKLILGVAPNGLIIFKSSVFDGQASDTSIFTQTNILEKLDPVKEAIMADKSLNIEAECVEHNITLIKPPKLEKSKHFSISDVELVKNICAARIHVDRTLQRFKMYKIMQTKISWRILPYIDDVCTIIAGIVNLKNPIPPDEEHLKLLGLHR